MQILLDADRRRIENVRVLITMRSDFIGDCAYLHGLSEAVSAAHLRAEFDPQSARGGDPTTRREGGRTDRA